MGGKAFRSALLIQRPYDLAYEDSLKQDLYKYDHNSLAGFTTQELIYSYEFVQDNLLSLLKDTTFHQPEVFRYVDDLIASAIRSGQAAESIAIMLNQGRLSKKGVFLSIEDSFSPMLRDHFRVFDFDCNQPSRRFDPELEYDLLVASMLMLLESTYKRTPSSICFYLHYSSASIRLHLIDNDGSLSNLELHMSEKEKWPLCYQVAEQIARFYRGSFKTDPTVTKGISIEMELGITEYGIQKGQAD